MNPIVGIGELLWDVFPDGHKVAGGAPFNFAFHCRQLGHDAVVVSRVGDDELGRELRAEVRRLGLTDEFIQTDRDHPTGTVRVTVDAAGVPSYEIVDDVAWDYIDGDAIRDVGFRHDIAAVCFGSLALRHPVSRSTIQNYVSPGPEMASALRVFDVNFRQPFIPPAAILKRCIEMSDWVKVNADELSEVGRMLGIPPTPTGLYVWHDLYGERDYPVWIITDGANGVRVASAAPFTEAGVFANVVDTVGAGDSFTAAMVCLALEKQRAPWDRVKFATHYAARVCEHRGATPRIDRAEVERAAFG